ncbi:MAG: glycosyltransferase 87 family protein, partial [bacterium]|nr:glycosyltransferase 87 family protein [bacterium]
MKYYFIIAFFGILLRLVLMPITSHSDLWDFYFSGHLFAYQGVFNIYDYLANLGNSDLARNYGTNYFTYPPLTYFLLGLFAFIFKPFSDGGFFSWSIANYPNVFHNPQVFKALFLTKLPYIFFDLGTAIFLAKLFTKEKEKKIAFTLWIFNPLAIYTSFMTGQFDIMAVFAVVTALYFVSVKKENLSVISLGLGGALKMFPLLLLPFFIFSLGKNWKSKITLAVLGLLPYFITILPFISSSAFRRVSLFSSQSEKMLFMSFPVSGAEGLYVFIMILVLLFAYSAYNPGKFKIWQYCMAVMFAFFSVTHYHPQWMLWLAPFFVIQTVGDRFKFIWLWLVMFASWIGIT